MNDLQFEKDYKAKGLASQRRYPNEALIKFLAENYFSLPIKKRKKIKILELGCGSGANLWMMTKESFDVYGIDVAPTGIKLAKRMMKLWSVSARLEVGNMRKLNFPDNFFDAIVDVVSVQHTDLKGHREIYQETYRCLKSGGLFFQWHLGARSISFREGKGRKIDESTLSEISNPKVPFYGCGLICFLTPKKAEKMLGTAGFKNINIETYTRTYKNRSQKIEYLAIQCEKNNKYK